MFSYYLALGFRSLRRNPVLTVLMVLTLSVGVAASMTTLTILKGMSGDPIPQKSDRLFVPLLDNNPADAQPGQSANPDAIQGEPPEQMTYIDTMNLWEAGKGLRQTPVYGLGPAIDSGRPDLPPFFGEGLAVGRDFFPMFDVPFLHGQAWSAEEDAKGASVVVISRSLSERLFGEGENPVGRDVRISDADYQIVGVIDTWEPLPKFYRIVGASSFDTTEDVFLPIRTAVAREVNHNGNMNCSAAPPEPGFKGYLKSECYWIQLWVELESASQRDEYADYLVAYVNEQKALGRFPRPINNRLHNVRQWLDDRGVVSDDTRTSTWLAFGFLLVCLVNTVGLLLAKFSARPGEIGVRRALGATRRDVFTQFIRNFDEDVALITHVDAPLLLAAVVLSVLAALAAGVLPTWRACQVVPALQLKSQ
jgi:putative ABC transport system permease protein